MCAASIFCAARTGLDMQICQHRTLLHTPMDLTQTQGYSVASSSLVLQHPPSTAYNHSKADPFCNAAPTGSCPGHMDHQGFPVLLLDPVPFVLKMQDKSTKTSGVAGHLNSRIKLISHNLPQVLL